MKRNVMQEWKNALDHAPAGRRSAWAQVLEVQRRDLLSPKPAPPFAEDMPRHLRATRRLRISDLSIRKKDDVAHAVLILRRNNRLLRERFGVEWPEAASVVCGEAVRRNMSAASLARVLTAGLRRDARRGGSA